MYYNFLNTAMGVRGTAASTSRGIVCQVMPASWPLRGGLCWNWVYPGTELFPQLLYLALFSFIFLSVLSILILFLGPTFFSVWATVDMAHRSTTLRKKVNKSRWDCLTVCPSLTALNRDSLCLFVLFGWVLHHPICDFSSVWNVACVTLQSLPKVVKILLNLSQPLKLA